MPEQKILIVTYYWPPSGGSGVQRWLKFVKYLPQFGWTPYVFTPENPSFVQTDESLVHDVPAEAEILRFPIWEPYDAFFKLTSFGKAKGTAAKPSQFVGKKKSRFTRVASWVRGNFLIPDPKIFWVRPSVSFLDDFLRDNHIRTIITTGPPHSVHLIGLRLKKKNPELNWIADFRDPWSEWSFLDSFNMTGLVKAQHRRLERKVLMNANHIVTITPFYVKRFEALSGRKVTLLTNGFDEDDFKNIVYSKPAKFTIRHIGIVYEMSNPNPLIESLTRLMNVMPEFKEKAVLEFIGEVNVTFREAIEQSAVAAITSFKKPVPHKELMEIYGSTSLLLLNIEGYHHAEGLLPGKVFEYLATGLPILGIGPVAGDAAEILKHSQAGMMFGKENIEGITSYAKEVFQKWKDSHVTTQKSFSEYSRKSITEKLIKLLK